MRLPSDVFGTTMKSLDWGGTLSGSATPLPSPLKDEPAPCFLLQHVPSIRVNLNVDCMTSRCNQLILVSRVSRLVAGCFLLWLANSQCSLGWAVKAKNAMLAYGP